VFKRWHLFFLFIAFFLIFLLLFRIREQLRSILEPFVIAIALAYFLNPLVNYIEKMLRGMGEFKKISPRLPAVIILYMILVSIVLFLGWYIIPALITESKKLIADIPNYIQEIQGKILLFRESGIKQLPKSISRMMDSNIEQVEATILNSLENLVMLILNFFSRMLNIVMIPVLTFYFLKDKNHFVRLIHYSIPRRWKSAILEIAKKSDRVIGNFIRGRLIVALIIGIFISIGLRIMGIQYAVIIGFIAGILDIIPFFGPVIGAVPAIILAFLQDPTKVIWVILLFIIVQQVEGDIIAPKIIGESLGLHPVSVIFSLLVGGTFFGIMGMILAIPATAILKIIIEYMVNHIATDDNY